MAIATVRAVVAVGRAKRDESGVILVMAVAGLVLAVVCCALSVDIGRQALEKRRDQSVADMAALDSARAAALNAADATPAALASALRNGFDPVAPGHSVTAELGTVDANNVFSFPAAGGTGAVRVTVSSVLDNVFAPGSHTLTARAIAKVVKDKKAGFTIGSSLAAVDTGKVTLLNTGVGQMIGGSLTATVLGWQGLVDGRLTLSDLQRELVDAGVQAGTLEEMLDAEITVAQLATATATALNRNGYSNVVAGDISREATVTRKFRLRRFITVAPGAGGAALAADVRAFQLLTAGALAANGDSLITFNAGLAVPGVNGTTVSLRVLEGPEWVYGSEGESGSTAQIELTVTPRINMPISVAGLTGVRATGDLPLAIAAAGATGTLKAIACPGGAGPGITVGVDTQAYSGTTTATMRVTATVLLVPDVAILDVPTTGTFSQPARSHPDLAFSYPSEFDPPGTSKRTGSGPVGLTGLMAFSQNGSPTVLTTAIPVPTSAVVTSLYAGLDTVMDDLDTTIVGPLLSSLGLSVGVADVTASKKALDDGCAPPPYPVLVG